MQADDPIEVVPEHATNEEPAVTIMVPGEDGQAEIPQVHFVENLPNGGQPVKAAPKRPAGKKRGATKGTPAVVRRWLKVESTGESNMLQTDKYKLTNKLGIQTRDLRLLDPHLTSTYPSAILCREKSIVVNLEHIKVIITTKFVLVVNPDESSSEKFINHLKTRLSNPNMPYTKAQYASTGDLTKAKSAPGMQDLHKNSGDGGAGSDGRPAGIPHVASAPFVPQFAIDLPFELRVLEICLDELAAELAQQTTELEGTAYPSVDELAAKVTSPRLEQVWRIKNRLVRLTTRVQTLRELLQRFLDDDEDMHDLNLSANEAREEMQEQMQMSAASMRAEQPDLARMSRNTISSASTNSSMVESEVAEVEMLLEAYFMQYDNNYNRLQTLNEYIKDTEDLVNIKLDQHRNQLITTDLILTALACAMALVTAVSGIFGMNLDNGLQEEPDVFNQVTIASSLGAILLFVGFVVWAWRKGLLVFS